MTGRQSVNVSHGAAVSETWGCAALKRREFDKDVGQILREVSAGKHPERKEHMCKWSCNLQLVLSVAFFLLRSFICLPEAKC
jgi:hypothetical protein